MGEEGIDDGVDEVRRMRYGRRDDVLVWCLIVLLFLYVFFRFVGFFVYGDFGSSCYD